MDCRFRGVERVPLYNSPGGKIAVLEPRIALIVQEKSADQ
jgi:hypothetical protein